MVSDGSRRCRQVLLARAREFETLSSPFSTSPKSTSRAKAWRIEVGDVAEDRLPLRPASAGERGHDRVVIDFVHRILAPRRSFHTSARSCEVPGLPLSKTGAACALACCRKIKRES
jgi:hypothetical protein